ncbi:MAG TPA: acyltransferase, partial [Solimonas sp.]|nr:acyltransferase [Solimonas sp.]
HTLPDGWERWHDLFQGTRYGLELFFMISGYLITETLLRKKDIASFAVDRALRLYPAFIGVLLPLTVLGILLRNEMFATTEPWTWPLHLLSNLLFLPGVFALPIVLPVAWSLSFEVAFYAVAALSFVLRQRGLAAAAALACGIIGVLLFTRSVSALYFGAGALVYLNRDGLLPAPLRRVPTVLSFFAMFALWHVVYIDYYHGQAQLNTYYATMISLALIAGLVFFDGVVRGQGLFSRFMRWRFLQFSATVSYSFYLWHVVLMFPGRHLLIPKLLPLVGPGVALLIFTIVSLALTFAVAYASYELLEVRLRKWLMRRIGLGSHPASAITSAA